MVCKKGIVTIVVMCAMFMTGCIVINTGQDDESKETQTQKEVIIKHENSDPSKDSSVTYTSKAYEVSEYVFYDSDKRYLTSSDLKGLSNWELKIARNEIYARRGRLFNDANLQNHFNSCTWYSGYIYPDKFNDDNLNKVEKYNIQLIKKYE